MTTYDDETTAVGNAVRELLQYEADLIECFRDDEGSLMIVLRGRNDDEMMFKLV